MPVYFYMTSIGKIGIAEEDGKITHLYFETDHIPKDDLVLETDVIQEAHRQLEKYLLGKLKQFNLPLNPQGTDFMKSVWQKLLEIPYAQTASYKDIAALLGNSKACRAVGMANNRNPIPIFIPCHRVVGNTGKLIGYRGGLTMQEKLLKLENKNLLL